MSENKEILQPQELTAENLEQIAGGAEDYYYYRVVRHRACGHTMRVDAPAGQTYVGMCPKCGEFMRERVATMTKSTEW